ncbi:putative Ig domain-containing protein [Myxococcota bacterium]|nr:putative Ig domain-containing protein [Myxococcota bacterium]
MRRTSLALVLAALSFATRDAGAQTARIDLRPVSITAPDRGIAGRTIAIDARFEAVGPEAPPPFRYSLLLTINGTTDGARTLGTFGPVSLLAGGSRQVTPTVTLPADVLGRFTIAAVVDVDDAVTEWDELGNTIFAAQEISIRAEAPNFAITGVAAREHEARAGEMITVDVTVRNTGELAGTVTLGAYVGPDAIVSTADVLLGETDVTVAAGQSLTAQITGLVPADAEVGARTIGAVADAADAVAEIDELDNWGTASRAFVVFEDAVAIETADLTDATLSVEYELALLASGGDGTYAWNLLNGTLPTGVVLDARGFLRGRPAASGTSTFTLQVSSHGRTAQQAYELVVHPTGAPLAIVDTPIAPGALGSAYEQRVVAAGGEPPYVWTVADDAALPPGLDLARDGIIFGLPTRLGEYTFELVVEDRTGATATRTIEISVTPPVNVLVLEAPVPAAKVGEPYEHTFEATGGVPPYRWEATTSLPPGMRITSDGQLTGTPTDVGRWPFRLQATDATSVGNRDTLLIPFVVEDDGALSITTTTLPDVTLRKRYEVTLEAAGGTPPLVWSLVPGDALPSGFFLIQGDGTDYPADVAIIRGLAVRSGAQAFAVQVEDSLGRRAQRVLLLDVLRPGQSTSGGGSSCVCVDGARTDDVIPALTLFALACLLAARRTRRPRA